MSWQGNPGRRNTQMPRVREAPCPKLFKELFNTLCDYNVINIDLSAQEASVTEVGEVSISHYVLQQIYGTYLSCS